MKVWVVLVGWDVAGIYATEDMAKAKKDAEVAEGVHFCIRIQEHVISGAPE